MSHHHSVPGRDRQGRTGRAATSVALGVGVLAAAALVNRHLAKRAERDTPPVGRFVEVDGIRLHYLERGEGEPLVLLHGNGSLIQDFRSSGLFDRAATRHRVIAFDRPGFGHSARPRGRLWTPAAQADLIARALRRLRVGPAIVLGHSWGASVAVQLGLQHPSSVRALVLASGYYYPTVRTDVLLLSGPAIPGLGDVVAHTVSPMLSRLIWPLVLRKIFGPAPTPEKFAEFPREMAFRPSQIRASAAETAYLVPAAMAARGRYGELAMPVAIVAGDEDRGFRPAVGQTPWRDRAEHPASRRRCRSYGPPNRDGSGLVGDRAGLARGRDDWPRRR